MRHLSIPEAVRRYAEAPAAFNPNLPEDMRLDDERFFIFFGRDPSVTLVMRLRLEGQSVAKAVDAVREIAGAREHRNVRWSVGTSSTPLHLVEQLLGEGMLLDDRAGNEAQTTAMVLVGDALSTSSTAASARRVESFDEFIEAAKIDRAAFELEDGWQEWLASAPSLWERERSGLGPRVYLAFVNGAAVGCARAIFDPAAMLLLGGGVLEEQRGNGAYRALMHARLAEAQAAGTPALAVHAGDMSRPILERLGFSKVAELTQLYDPATV